MFLTVVHRLLGIACASTIASALASCHIAVCLSGAIRSFVHPTVHNSIKINLIEAMEADGCEVDVFAYATRKDTPGRGKKPGTFDFKPNTSDIETALAILAPTRLIWHQEQAGVIPNSCPTAATVPSADGGHVRHRDRLDLPTWPTVTPDKSVGLYWQLYKSLAAYRMALREEKRKGGDFSYDWILRARFDVAWVRPLPPLRSFSRDSVWFNRHFWSMSDQFAMVPRAFSDRFFAAVSAFYACDGQSWPPPVSWLQPACQSGFEETVLFRHLHAAGVPCRNYFMFEHVITRGGRGGLCFVGKVAFVEACNLLGFAGEFRHPITSQDCSDILGEWANLRCRALLPARVMGDARRSAIISAADPRAWERLAGPSSQTPLPPPAAEDGATEEAAQVGREYRGESGHFGRPSDTLVPTVEDIDRVHSKLVLLMDAVLGHPQAEDIQSIFDNFEAKNSSRSGRWDAWQAMPPSSVFSLKDCPISEPQFQGLSPHIITYYTMGAPLIKELAQALRCFVSSLVEKTQESRTDFDARSCDGVRTLEMVMIDVAHHTEELGICTADGTLGMSAQDHMHRFFSEPAVHCKGYGQIRDD